MCFQIKSHGNINCNIKLSYKTVYNPNLIETMKLTVFYILFHPKRHEIESSRLNRHKFVQNIAFPLKRDSICCDPAVT